MGRNRGRRNNKGQEYLKVIIGVGIIKNIRGLCPGYLTMDGSWRVKNFKP